MQPDAKLKYSYYTNLYPARRLFCEKPMLSSSMFPRSRTTKQQYKNNIKNSKAIKYYTKYYKGSYLSDALMHLRAGSSRCRINIQYLAPPNQ